jgi:Protein of unknown function (DUF3105)
VAAKKSDQERKAKIAQMQRQAKAAERRRTVLIVGAAGLVVALIAGAVAFAIISDDSRAPSGGLTAQGLPAADAGCDPVTEDKAAGAGNHVGPGTNKPTVTTIKYSTVPPTTGEHFPTPEFPNRQFYTADDRPKMENLVHNLEHGYSVLWYDDTLSTEEVSQLKAISREANKTTEAQQKFLVSAWDPAYGKLPTGKHVALSHWAADAKDLKKQSGHRLLCGSVSGEAVQSFIKKYPRTSAPEPNAQ